MLSLSEIKPPIQDIYRPADSGRNKGGLTRLAGADYPPEAKSAGCNPAEDRRDFDVKERAFSSLVLVVLALAFCGCAVRAVRTTEWGDLNAERRVLIATQTSEFKEAVVARIVEGLKEDLYYVKVIDLKALKGEPATEYDAIVVVNTCKAWSMSRGASRFVKNFEEREKVVLLTTAGGGDWMPKLGGLDAITSASKSNKVEPLANEIVGKVQKILNPVDAE
jgi:hypothetical protein